MFVVLFVPLPQLMFVVLFVPLPQLMFVVLFVPLPKLIRKPWRLSSLQARRHPLVGVMPTTTLLVAQQCQELLGPCKCQVSKAFMDWTRQFSYRQDIALVQHIL
jgi:hypothetical protein